MRRLYLRIYFAVLASIVLSVVLAGLAWRLAGDAERPGPDPAFHREAAAALLPPPDAPRAQVEAALDRWASLSNFDLALRAPDGALIAATGEEALRDHPRRPRFRGAFGHHVIALDDGRTLVAMRRPGPPGAFRGFGWLVALIAIALAAGLSAWPIVRRLTRNLEDLEARVAAFGRGDLAARAIVRGRDETARLAATFNESADRIEALMRANRTLLANASHELRSPLARLRMSVETLGADAPPALKNELARNVRELDQLVDEILLASRIDAGRVETPEREAIDLAALAAEECARVDADLMAAGSIEITGDARLLRRLLRNLLENALRHGGAGSPEVSATLQNGFARIDVCDRGPGVPEAERERIFEPFYRLPGASESDGGVGLGLSLARKIAVLHGGDLVCLGREGGGACFRLTLPLPAAGRSRET
jgi:signal transduction histidine kinase